MPCSIIPQTECTILEHHIEDSGGLQPRQEQVATHWPVLRCQWTSTGNSLEALMVSIWSPLKSLKQRRGGGPDSFPALGIHRIHNHGHPVHWERFPWWFCLQARANVPWGQVPAPHGTHHGGPVSEVHSTLDWKAMGLKEACTIIFTEKREMWHFLST